MTLIRTNLAPELTYNDPQLLQQVAEGSEQAFHALYTHYYPLIRPFALRYTRSDHAAEEILQETFIRVWLHRDQLPEIDNLKAWMFTIAARVYMGHIRKVISDRKRMESLAGAEQAEQYTPEDQLHVQQIRSAIRIAVQRLPEQKRKVYRMNREQGLKPGEIAGELGIPVGTVKNQLSAALKDIRAHLVAEGFGTLAMIAAILKIF